MVSPSSLDDDDAGEDDDGELEIDNWDGKASLLKLLEFCALQSKSDMVKCVLCDGAFDGGGKVSCINSACAQCGFGKQIWSKRLRSHVVDASDNLRPSVPVEFSSQVIPTPPLPPHPHLHILPHPAPPCPALPFPAPPHLTPR